MNRLLPALLLVALLGGCHVPPIRSGATVTASKLPESAAELVKYADDIYVQAVAKPEVTAAMMENALLALDKALGIEPTNFEVAWKAARTAAWLADELYDDKTKRAHFSGRGMDYAKVALTARPTAVEGHYYNGICSGLSATAKTVGAKFMVPSVRDAGKKALQIDPAYDHGGPPRLLGALYANAPPWPASIGDPEKGVEYLEQASKLASDFPLNNLQLGVALAKAERFADAKKQFELVLAAQPTVDDGHFLPRWKTKAKEGLEELSKRSASS